MRPPPYTLICSCVDTSLHSRCVPFAIRLGVLHISTDVHFPDGFDEPETIAFGLGAPQLTVVAVGALCAWSLLHAPGPAVAVDGAALLVGGTAAALGWGRWRERPVLEWAWLWTRFIVTPGSGGSAAASAVEPRVVGLLLSGGDEVTPPPEEVDRSAASGGVGSSGEAAPPPPPRDEDEPPWARWLRERASSVPAPAAAPATWTPERTVWPASIVSDDAAESAIGALTTADGGRAGSVPLLEAPPPRRSLRQWWDQLRPSSTSDDHRPDADVDERGAPPSLEPDRLPLVLIPRPAPTSDSVGASSESHDADIDEATDGAVETAHDSDRRVLRLPLADSQLDDELMLELADSGASAPEIELAPRNEPRPAPVFAGATRRITFFSLNGGTGRTMLATEVACLLAGRGRHSAADGTPQRLRVTLVDLDLRSANIAVRLGIPQPTLWDYLMQPQPDPDDLDRFTVRHSSGLRALLGPPKPAGSESPVLETARVAEVVHGLERDGTHFLILDTSADLGAMTTWVLSAVHDIFVVITPTASGIQDAYRSTEALRRLGVGHKVQYVVNRARIRIDLSEVMADLGGRIAACVPYDPRIEDAENRHRSVALAGDGPAAEAIAELAASIYPGLAAPRRRSRMGFLGRRRAG